MTAKNIWLAENVLEILTEQRYGAREAVAEAGAIRRAAAVAESAPQLPARRVCHPAPVHERQVWEQHLQHQLKWECVDGVF